MDDAVELLTIVVGMAAGIAMSAVGAGMQFGTSVGWMTAGGLSLLISTILWCLERKS